MKTMFYAAAAALLVPAAASANSHMEPGKLPKCSAKVTDSCDQSMTTEKNAMTAAQAEASGGVGDRSAMKPMPAKKKVVYRKKVTTTTTSTSQ